MNKNTITVGENEKPIKPYPTYTITFVKFEKTTSATFPTKVLKVSSNKEDAFTQEVVSEADKKLEELSKVERKSYIYHIYNFHAQWKDGKNTNIATKHFVIIMETGFDENVNKKYYRFYDVGFGTENEEKGTDIDNLLYVETDFIRNLNFKKKYTLTAQLCVVLSAARLRIIK